MYKFGSRSRKQMENIHPDLKKMLNEVINDIWLKVGNK